MFYFDREEPCECRNCGRTIGENRTEDLFVFKGLYFCDEECLVDYFCDNEYVDIETCICEAEREAMAIDFAIDCARGK